MTNCKFAETKGMLSGCILKFSNTDGIYQRNISLNRKIQTWTNQPDGNSRLLRKTLQMLDGKRMDSRDAN